MRRCEKCLHCEASPAELEELLPGLRILSSAYGASRGDTAFCRLHNRFFRPGPACPEFFGADLLPLQEENSPNRRAKPEKIESVAPGQLEPAGPAHQLFEAKVKCRWHRKEGQERWPCEKRA
jgi:hypothetical protein